MFWSYSALVPEDTDDQADSYIWDRTTGDVYVCDRVAGTTTAITDSDAGSFLPVISGGGQHVAFTSREPNLVAGDTNGIADVFVWSRRPRW